MRARIVLLPTLFTLCFTASPLWGRHKHPDKPASGATPTFSVNSRLVVLDVVVLNHNKPVCSLSQSDFQVLEDRKAQVIQNFESHCAESLNGNISNENSAPALPPNTYSNAPVHPTTDSVTVLLLDGLNTPASDNQYLRRRMLEYLKVLPPGRRIAIFALGSRLRMLQGFTANSGQLLAAMGSAKATSAASLLPSAEDRSQNQQMVDWLTEGGAANAAGLLGKSDQESDVEQAGFRTDVTLQAIDQLAAYLSGIPGRKNLVWFSGSFPVQFLPGSELLPNGMGSGMVLAQFEEKLKRTADLLDAARVAVYPVDIRGPVLQSMFTAAQNQDYGAVVQNQPVGGQRFDQDTLNSQASLDSQNTAMKLLAEDTGGQATFGSNALQKAVANALSDGANFYTITYAPQSTDFNGEWRTISVNIDTHAGGGKYKLLYRHGYYASNTAFAQSAGTEGAQKVLGAAMQEGVPPASEILFQAKVIGEPPSGPISGQDRALSDRAARYAIDYAISLKNVELTPAPKDHHSGKLYVEAVAYRDDGKVANGIADESSVTLDKSQWTRRATDRLQVHQLLDLPKGDIHLRLGVYDPASGNLGTMEIPLQVVPLKSAASCAQSCGQTPATNVSDTNTATILGAWHGTLHLPDRDLGDVLKIARSPSGQLTAMFYSAAQGIGGNPASYISFKNGVLRWGIESLTLTYAGQMSANGNAMVGTLTQAGSSLRLDFERATPEPGKVVSIAGLEPLLNHWRGQPRGKLAGELDDVMLTQRVDRATLAAWEAEFPSSEGRNALMKLADLSAFRNPPASDVIGNPPPDRNTQAKTVVRAAHYVMATMSHLPDFFATRVTTHFEGSLALFHEDISASRSSELLPVIDTWFGEGTAGLRPAGVSSRTVTYRDGEEVPLENGNKPRKEPSIGLTSNGEFGPILVQVLGDAIKNGMEFVRWEKSAEGPAAVFAYTVPANASHFPVKFMFAGKVLTMLPAYHGEIAIDPQTGAILRLTEIADMPPADRELGAAIAVDFAPVSIGGRSDILPVRSVTFSRLPVAVYNSEGISKEAEADPNIWPIQTYMNDVAFTDYHQFRATVKLLPAGKGQAIATAPKGSPPTGDSPN